MPRLICQEWEESERGWGVRPEGYSLHISADEALAFISEFMNWQRKYFEDRGVDGVPDEYERPAGPFYECEVSQEMYEEVLRHGSLRRYRHDGDLPEPVQNTVSTAQDDSLRPDVSAAIKRMFDEAREKFYH